MESYKVIREIGKGSFGKVYLVKHAGEGRQYVMKIIKLKGIPQKEREACKNEVTLMQRLQHPNIVAYKESFFANGQDSLCIVMTFCDGGDLAGRLAAAKGALFKEDQILHWFVQLCLAIHYMHENRVLHRDIKCQNIFLLGNGRLVLGDLGISKVLDGTAAFASTQIGTPYYMSPELFRSKPYNHKSDVWALGCVLYELCTLNHPFDATSLSGLAQKIMKGVYAPINAKYSASLQSLIGSMLALNPASRPSVADILKQPYVKKHVYNFIRDIADRSLVVPRGLGAPGGGVGDGTMMFKAAAVRVSGAAAADPGYGGADAMSKAVAAGLGPHANNLQAQLLALGLQPIVAKAMQDAAAAAGIAAEAAPAAPAPAPAPAAVVKAAPAPAPAPAAARPPGGGAAALGGGVPAPRLSAAPIVPIGVAVAPPAAAAQSAAAAAAADPAAAARRLLKEQQSALDREEERKRAVELALARLKQEKELRAKQREEFRRKQERAALRGLAPGAPVPLPAPLGGGGLAAAAAAARPSAGGIAAAAPRPAAAAPAPAPAPAAAAPAAAAGRGPALVKAPSAPAPAPATSASSVSSSSSAARREAELKERAAAIRRDALAAEAAKKAKLLAALGGEPGDAVAAGRQAAMDARRVAELDAWERERPNRPNAKAVGVAALQALAAGGGGAAPAAPAGSGSRPSSSQGRAAAAPAPAPAPAKAPATAGAGIAAAPRAAAPAPAPLVGGAIFNPPQRFESAAVGGGGAPPKPTAAAPAPAAAAAKPTAAAPAPAPAGSGRAPSAPRSVGSAVIEAAPAVIPVGARAPSPSAAAAAASAASALDDGSLVVGAGIPTSELAPWLPANYDALPPREKVLARREAVRRYEEARTGAILKEAALGSVAERRRAQVQARELYHGVSPAVASALPQAAAAGGGGGGGGLAALLPGARYGSAPGAAVPVIGSAGEGPLRSESKYLDAGDEGEEGSGAPRVVRVGRKAEAELPAAAAAAAPGSALDATQPYDDEEEEDSGYYGVGDFPDSDSDDSVILSAARGGAAEGFAAGGAGPQLALATEEDDEEDIQAQEEALVQELLLSTARCNGLRASVDVARKMVGGVGGVVGGVKAKAVAPSAAAVAPAAVKAAAPAPAPAKAAAATAAAPAPSGRLDDRPLRPAKDPRHFWTEAEAAAGAAAAAAPAPAPAAALAAPAPPAPTPFGHLLGGGAQAALPAMYAVYEEDEDEEGDDDDELGDEDGNAEGALDFTATASTRSEEEEEEEEQGGGGGGAGGAGVGLASTLSEGGGVAVDFKRVDVPTPVQPLAPSPPAPVGTLAARIEGLRKWAIASLGSSVFDAVYTTLRERLFEDEDEGAGSGGELDISDIRGMVGRGQEAIIDCILQLIDMEEACL